MLDTQEKKIAFQLRKPLKLGPNIKIVLLPFSGNIKTGSKAVVTGWGKTSVSLVVRSLAVLILAPMRIAVKIYRR